MGGSFQEEVGVLEGVAELVVDEEGHSVVALI